MTFCNKINQSLHGGSFFSCFWGEVSGGGLHHPASSSCAGRRLHQGWKLQKGCFDPILIQRRHIPLQKCLLINQLIFFQNLITKAEEAPNKEVKCWFHPACFIFIIFGFLSQLLWLIFWSFTNYHRYPKFSARADRTSPERQGKARARENIGP